MDGSQSWEPRSDVVTFGIGASTYIYAFFPPTLLLIQFNSIYFLQIWEKHFKNTYLLIQILYIQVHILKSKTSSHLFILHYLFCLSSYMISITSRYNSFILHFFYCAFKNSYNASKSFITHHDYKDYSCILLLFYKCTLLSPKICI